MVETRSQADPAALAQELSLMALETNQDVLEELCQKAISEMSDEANAVRQGNIRVLNKLVGAVMKASRGRADALAVQRYLKEILGHS